MSAMDANEPLRAVARERERRQPPSDEADGVRETLRQAAPMIAAAWVCPYCGCHVPRLADVGNHHCAHMPDPPVDTAALAEQLKDFAHDHGMATLRATVRTGRDSWLTIEVRHASLWGDSPDGWDTTIRRESL